MSINIRLFNDTQNLSHTRGAFLIDVCRLCAFIYKFSKKKRLKIHDLAILAEKNGLKHFQNTSKKTLVGTRARHYWYSLEALNLVDKHENEYELSNYGVTIAELSISENLIADNEIKYILATSEIIRAELVRIAFESEYLKRVWFSNFINEPVFSSYDLLLQDQAITIERIYPKYRIENLSDFFDVSSQVSDSGYRLYTLSNWSFDSLGIPPRIFTSVGDFKTLILSDTARKELHEGIRRWTTYELEITMETPLLVPSDDIEVVDKRRHVWLVKQHIDPNDRSSLEKFSAWVENTIKMQGNGKRIRIPELIINICKINKIGLSNAKNLLLALYRNSSDKFYFEAASEGVIFNDYGEFSSAPEPWDYFLKIDGIWRPSIMLLKGDSDG